MERQAQNNLPSVNHFGSQHFITSTRYIQSLRITGQGYLWLEAVQSTSSTPPHSHRSLLLHFPEWHLSVSQGFVSSSPHRGCPPLIRHLPVLRSNLFAGLKATPALSEPSFRSLQHVNQILKLLSPSVTGMKRCWAPLPTSG